MTGLSVGPKVVDEMDMREINDLMDYWMAHPPTHIVTAHLRDVVITGLGGKPPSAVPERKTTAEELAAAFGLKLPARVKAPNGG